MTICTATIFSWNYSSTPGEVDPGYAVLAASDRLLTDDSLGIRSEGDRWKAGHFTQSHMILVSGAMTVNTSLAIKIGKVLQERTDWTTVEIAEKWSKLLLDYTRSEAALLYLAPLNLTEENFISQTKLMERNLAAQLASQMQEHHIDVEAIVVGCDAKTDAHLYHIDKNGRVTCHNHMGFVAIGAGGIHAAAYYMTEGHSAQNYYFKALFTTFSAKKRAEVSPFVGDKNTDMFLITKDAAAKIPDGIMEAMQQIYEEHAAERKKMIARDLERIVDADARTRSQPPPDVQAPTSVASASEGGAASAGPSPSPSSEPKQRARQET